MEIKKTDFNQIQGWMTRIRIKEPDGSERTLSAYELLIFAKLYGFVQDNQGICRSQEEYFMLWSRADRKTVYTALKLFEFNEIIKTKRYFDKNVKKTRNSYFINTSKLQLADDSNLLVKNTSSITILPFQLSYDIKSYTSIVYALIHQYSKDGISTCKVSREYLAEWCIGASQKTIKRILDKLHELKLIASGSSLESPSGIEYWSTESRLHPETNGQNSPLIQNNEMDKIPHCSGQNSPSLETEFPIALDKIPHLNLSKNLSLKKVEVKKDTTTFFIPQNIKTIFEKSSLPDLISEKSFIQKYKNWYNSNNPSDKIAEAFITDLFIRFDNKKNKNPGLFVTMFESQADYKSFLIRYEEAAAAELKKEQDEEVRKVECPVCQTISYKHSVCKCCNFDMNERTNEIAVNEARALYRLSESQRNAYEEEINEVWNNPEYAFMKCMINHNLAQRRDNEILAIKQKYGVVA